MTQTDTVTRLATSADQKTWDKLANHPLQSWAWGDFRQTMGLQVVRLITEKGQSLASISLLTFHHLPYTPFTVGYFPKGSLPTTELLTKLKLVGQQQKAIFIQLEPNVTSSFRGKIAKLKLLQPAHHPLFTQYTFVLDLTKPEEELFQGLHHKTRYNIRLAQKHGVEIKEDNSPQAFNAYLRLSQETVFRQGFYAHNEDYHRQMWQVMHKTGIAHLWTATYQNNVLATWIIFAWKDMLYYPYGASQREHREVMAPNLLLWEIARWGKKQGFKGFDLWGALGPNPNPHDPWYGFNRFKEGYQPQLVEFCGSHDLVINQFFYSLYKIADSLRWNWLKLKR